MINALRGKGLATTIMLSDEIREKQMKDVEDVDYTQEQTKDPRRKATLISKLFFWYTTTHTSHCLFCCVRVKN